MSPLVYLTLTKLKNQVKGLFRSPAKLIYAIVLLALLVFVFVAGSLGDAEVESYRPLAELGAIATAFYTLMFLMTANSGFSTGMSVFKMPDVNLLFAGPFRPVRVLFYGMFQQMASSLLMGAFLLFQYAWLHSSYGVGPLDMLAILLGYSFAVFTGQLAAMVIYCLTSGSDRRRRVARGVFVAVPAAYALWLFLLAARAEGALLPTLVDAAGGLAVRLFPVGGWLGGAVSGAIRGDGAALALGLALWALGVAALAVVMSRADQDYYEDVLQSTETAFQAQAAAKEGRMTEAAPRKLRRGKTGLGGGAGASAFWYKHRIENRRSRRVLLSGAELLFALVSVGFAFFMRESGGLVAAVAFAEYMQFFSVALGRLNKELTKPYIYLVPEPSFRKLLWCLRESLGGYLASAVLIFVPVCLLLGYGPAEMAACVLMHLAFSYLFVAGNLVTERVFGAVTVKALVFLFYFLVLLLVAAPGLAVMLLVSGAGLVVVSAAFTNCLVLAAVNLAVALLAVFLCRNLLAHAELNN